MPERLEEEQINTLSVISEEVLRVIVNSQMVINKAQDSSGEEGIEEFDYRSRMFEGTLESIEPALYGKEADYNTVSLSTLKGFLSAPDFDTAQAVEMWSKIPLNNREENYHFLRIQKQIQSLGIDGRAMDFLALGLPLYKRSLLSDGRPPQTS